MTDLASLVLAVDSSQVPRATASLDGLTAAGARAEAATVGLGRGSKTAAAEAAAMAAAAQASARAATGMATGFKASSDAMRVNTVAMRETLVVARELSRGNFTRVPGSLTLLAQGIGSQGGLKAFGAALAQTLGLVKIVQNAELAEAAASAAASAASIESAAARAASAVTAADTELALAEAQLRVTAGTSAESVAQVRLAEAHQAVAAAAAEAAVAENALAGAYAKADEAAAASAATTRTLIGGTGIGLVGIGTVALVAYGAIKQFQDQVKDSGVLDRYAESSRLTAEQIKKLGGEVDYLSHNTREVTGLTVTFGDVMFGVWQEIAKEAGFSSDSMKHSAGSAFSGILDIWNQTSAAISAGFYTLADIAKDVFQYIGQKIGQGFYDGVNKAIDAINNLNAKIPKWAGGGDPNLIPHLTSGPPIKDLGSLGATIRSQADKNYAEALAANRAAFAGVGQDAIDHRLSTLSKLSDAHNPPKPPKAKKQPRNPADDELAKLDAEIAGQNALAQAYLTSDAAVIKAQADEKAMVLAVEKHANAAQTAALKSKELALAIASTTAEGAKEINNLTFEASTRKQVNDMIAAGLIPASQANEYMELESKLRPLIAAQSLAEGAAKKKLTDEINKLTDAYANNQAEISRLKALQGIAANDNETEKLKLETTLLGASNRERAVAIAQLEAMQQLRDMPGLSAQEQQNFIQSAINKAQAGIQTPFQQWAATIPQTAEAISDAFATIQTHGLDTFAQGITDVITGTKSLGSAFKDVARSIIGDIIQMTVRMLVFRAVSSLLPGLFGGGGGLGSFAPSFGTDFTTQPTPAHFANGGSFVIGGNPGVDQNVLSINGQPKAMVGNGETLAVFPRGAANNNSRAPIEVHVTLVADAGIDARIEDVSARQIGQAAPAIVRASVQQTMRVAGRPKLMGR